jgi:hypothetical protein
MDRLELERSQGQIVVWRTARRMAEGRVRMGRTAGWVEVKAVLVPAQHKKMDDQCMRSSVR